MDDIIDDLHSESFSEANIKKVVDCDIVVYEDLVNYNDIDDLLGPHQCCVLLYQQKQTYGHWVCLSRRGNIVEFFDSYGGKPDSQLKFAKYNKHNDQPYLSQMLYESPYEIRYNPYKLQSEKNDMNTCGRWVTLRLVLRHVPIDVFAKLFLKQRNKPDFYATALTMFIA